MGKSVYSIVLSDRVVEQLDRWAAREGISRSTAVDRILASHLSMTTPEQAAQEVLAQVGRLLEQSALPLLPTLSDGLLAVRAPVRFQYNPAVRVVVALSSSARGSSGELRAAARTQSARLIEALDGFFLLFSRAARFDPGNVVVGDGRFLLRFLLPDSDGDEAAQQIASLLELMQTAMTGYFAEYPDRFNCESAVREVCDAARGLPVVRIRMDGRKK